MDEDDEQGPNEYGGSADGIDGESLTAYIVDEVARALAAHERAARGTVQHTLPLGEALALFNLADQFGLIDAVRTALDRRLGTNAYLAFSEAMKAALLDRGASGDGGGGARPGHPSPGGQRQRPGQQGRPDQRGGRPPGGHRRGPR